MGTARRRLLGVCAMLMAIAVANAASGEVGSVVVGLAKCADCTRKNMKAEAAFKGLRVAIKCKNSNGEYKSKAVGELQSSGAFRVPLSTDIHGANCLAQLHSAAGTPCQGQEPSRITPLADGIFVVIPENTQQPSADCASVTICGPIKKHFLDHFHKKPEQPKPQPEPKPEPENQPPTPSYSSPPPIYAPPAMHSTEQLHKDHELDYFHKKPTPPEPKPEPKPQPDYNPPTPMYGSPTPTDSYPTSNKHHFFDHFYKGHDHHHFFDHFHTKPVPPEPKPQPDNNSPRPSSIPIYPPPPTPLPTPIYPPPAKH